MTRNAPYVVTFDDHTRVVVLLSSNQVEAQRQAEAAFPSLLGIYKLPSGKAAREGEPIFLAQLRNGSTTWLQFSESHWHRLDAEWDKRIAYKP